MYSVKQAETKAGEKVWQADIWGKYLDGKPYRKICYLKDGLGEYVSTERRAKDIAKAMEDNLKKAYEITRTDHLRPKEEATAITFAEFMPSFMQTKLVGGKSPRKPKPGYLEGIDTHWKSYLKPVVGDLPLNKLADSHIDVIKKAMAVNEITAHSANKVLGALSVILKWALKKRQLESVHPSLRNPLTGALAIELVPEEALLKEGESEDVKYYDFEDYETLVSGAAKVGWKTHALVLLAGDAGLRRGEIMALEQSDIDFKRQTINVQRSEYNGAVTLPKGGRARRVRMTERLAKLLQANKHLEGDRVLYRTYHGKQKTLNDKSVVHQMEKAEKRAGMKVTGKIHILRHTFCSHLAMRGATVLQIKELAGHEQISTTQKYMHLAVSFVDDAIKLLDKGHATKAA